MTLVAGMLCSDAILLFSDREENVGFISKRSVGKIHEALEKTWTMAIAGSGRSSICDLAARQIITAAHRATDTFPTDHEQIIADALTPIVARHVYASFLPQQSQQDRGIALIIGVNDKKSKQKFLYKTEDEILCPCHDFACAGYGEEIATYFLVRLYDSGLSYSEANVLARFIVREAKESVQKVGLGTDLITLHDDGPVTRGHYSNWADYGQDLPHQLSDCVNAFWKRDTKQRSASQT